MQSEKHLRSLVVTFFQLEVKLFINDLIQSVESVPLYFDKGISERLESFIYKVQECVSVRPSWSSLFTFKIRVPCEAFSIVSRDVTQTYFESMCVYNIQYEVSSVLFSLTMVQFTLGLLVVWRLHQLWIPLSIAP